MNKFIKEQLDKSKITLPEYDQDTTELFIRRHAGNALATDLLVGYKYLVYVEDYIVHEPENFTLSANWNGGTKPTENKLYIQVVQVMGKMVRVNSIGSTSNIQWSGWLPRKSITIMEELDV